MSLSTKQRWFCGLGAAGLLGLGVALSRFSKDSPETPSSASSLSLEERVAQEASSHKEQPSSQPARRVQLPLREEPSSLPKETSASNGLYITLQPDVRDAQAVLFRGFPEKLEIQPTNHQENTYIFSPLAAGDYYLLIKASLGYLVDPLTHQQSNTPDRRTYFLEAGKPVFGRVVEKKTLMGIQDAHLLFFHRDFAPLSITTKTRESGQYSALLHKKGNYNLTVQADGFLPLTLYNEAPTSKNLETVVLEAGATLTFTVKNKEQQLVAAKAHLLNSFSGDLLEGSFQQPIQPQQDGTYVIRGISRTPFSLFLQHEGYEKKVLPVTPPEQGDITLGTLYLSEGSSLIGIVYDAEQKPVSQATVFLRRPESLESTSLLTATQTTNEQGAFAIPHLEDAPYILFVSHPNHAPSRLPLRVDEPKEHVIVRLARGYDYANTTLDDEGRYLPEARVFLTKFTDGKLDTDVALEQLADAQGRFSFTHLPQGQYELFAVKLGYAEARNKIEIPGQKQPVTLAKKALLEGRVYDDITGQPIRSCEVFITSREKEGKVGSQYFTDREGLFRLPRGNIISLKVMAAGYQPFTLQKIDGTTSLDALYLKRK